MSTETTINQELILLPKKPDLRGFEIDGVIYPSESSDQQFIYIWTNKAIGVRYQHVVEQNGVAMSEWYGNQTTEGLNNEKLLDLINYSAGNVIDMIETTVCQWYNEGTDVTRETIEAQIESSVNIALTSEQWHIQQALLLAVKETIDIEYLIDRYSLPS